MLRVVVTDSTFTNLDREREVAARHGATWEEAHCSSPEDIVRTTGGANVLLVQFAQITERVIERLSPNAAIVRYGLGLDNIDLPAARRRGVRVAYVPDYATGEVADHTAALILGALRKIIPLDRSVRNGLWDVGEPCRPMASVAQSVVGFIGFGRIGREVQARLQPFGFASLIADPYLDSKTLGANQVRCVSLETLLSTSDVITLHAPLTPVTRHLLNRTTIGLMKSTALIVNTARGGLIDTVALTEALATNRIGGAALDVFEEEPLPANAALRTFPNVILTPHVAWYSEHSIDRLHAQVADELDRHLSGRPPRCPAPMPSLL